MAWWSDHSPFLFSQHGRVSLRENTTRLTDRLRTQVHSKRDVTLVGAMHYNPVQDPCPLTFESLTPSTQVSIALAERCVEEQEGLGAVVVESCESRWRRTQEVSPPGSIGRVLLPSEMLATACVEINL